MPGFPKALVPCPGTLMDERQRPDFREVFGTLACQSDTIATAVTRVRLTTIDLSADEMREVSSFRVLVSELSALRLDGEARALACEPRRAANVALLLDMLEAGRITLRSAPLGGWSPDFTVFTRASLPTWVMTGFHWFERPYPHRGPALASVHGGDAARLAAKRFDELWTSAHDVGPAVWTILARAGWRRSAMVAGADGLSEGR
jgi:hypothetical protein